MFDDLLGELFRETVFGRLTPSRRAQLLVRMFFGLLGAGLGIAGAVHFARRPDVTSNTPMWVSMVAMFVFLASFSLFNVGLGRTWRWPGRLFLVSLGALFMARIAFGR
jgi:hypothetical protein